MFPALWKQGIPSLFPSFGKGRGFLWGDGENEGNRRGGEEEALSVPACCICHAPSVPFPFFLLSSSGNTGLPYFLFIGKGVGLQPGFGENKGKGEGMFLFFVLFF